MPDFNKLLACLCAALLMADGNKDGNSALDTSIALMKEYDKRARERKL